MPWQAVPRYVSVTPVPSTAQQSSSSSRWEQLTRLHVPEIGLLREPFIESQTRDSNDLQAELELAFYGEVAETLQALAVNFEVQNAAWDLTGSGATAVRKTRDHVPGQLNHQPLLAQPTCASAYTALLHRRAACLREVLTAQARHADEHSTRNVETTTTQNSCDLVEDSDLVASEGQNSQSGGQGSSSSLAQSKPQPPLVQQLLCSFIELAASTHGKAATQALRAVSTLLAAQRPLVLVTERANWLPQLLGWLSNFLHADGEADEDAKERMEVRGIAAGAMLDLGLCSGSLRCVLLTVAALLKHSSRSESGGTARNLDCKHVAASVQRLRQCCSVTPASSPCGGPTVFLPVSQLEAPLVPSLQLRGQRSPAGEGIGGKFVAVASDGRFLYVHSVAGLVKYGSGYRGTVAGHVYAIKARYRSTERPWLACVDNLLYLRSPAMAPDSLVVVDCVTLEEVGTVQPGGRGGIELNDDGSASALTPEKGSRPGGGGGGGDGGGPSSDRPAPAHPGSSSRSAAERTDGPGPYGAVLGSTEMDVVEPSEMEMHGMFMDEPPALRSFYNDIRRQRSHRAAVMSTLEQLSRGASRTATAPALSAGEGERRASLDPASSSERSPLITDGRLLHIISKSSERQAQQQQGQQQPAQQQQEIRDEDDESSEGGGQIGSTWANVSFTIDTFDPADGMRHVRSVKIRGPVCETGVHDGEGTLCCDVCGLLMGSSSPGHRCLVCNPEYDLCDQCLMRGAATLGHRPDHQTREMDASTPREGGGEQQHLPAFPGECLECQSFYTDGRYLMVIIPPHLFGSKIAGYLCRVFCMLEGHHLYDISMGDTQEDLRKDLGKAGMTGSSCYDAYSDIVWNVDVDGARVRRWRHPWTAPLSETASASDDMEEDSMALSSIEKGASPIGAALKAILSCLYDAAEKHARCVMEPCHDSLQSWVPFCVESLPSTFAVIATIVKMCIGEDGNGRWLVEEQVVSEQQTAPDRTQCLHILRTCMRLMVVNVAQISPNATSDSEEEFETSLRYLRTSIMNLAELSIGPSADELLISTCEEAGNVVVAGLDVLFPDTEQQATLLIELLERTEPSRILKAAAMQLSKPGAHNLVFAMFDGTWLAGGKERVAMAHKLLHLLFERVASAPHLECDADLAELGVEEDGISHSTLLHLLAAFQRNLLSVPLSVSRSTKESEELLLFYARCLMDHAIRAVEHCMGQEGETKLSSPFVRVVMPPFCSVLADSAWSQNLNVNIGRELLPSLQPLLRSLEKLNCKIESVRHQDRAFSLKSTESRFLAGKTVSIPRARHSRPVPVVVKMPGAASMVVRISEDVILSRKETLRIHKDRESGSSSASTIKGSHRGKRLWRSFKVPGDTVYLTYTRTGHSHDELKVSKHIRCSVYGCAKNTSLLLPLDWLLDLELTLGSLTARFMWSSLREVPKPINAPTLPWLNSVLFTDGLKMEWLAARKEFAAIDGEQTAETPQGMDVDPDDGLAMLGALLKSESTSPFEKLLHSHVREHVCCPEWVDRELLLSLTVHLAAALINVLGLVGLVEASTDAKSIQDLPEPLKVVFTASVRLVQTLVMQTRKKLQELVLLRSDSAQDEESIAKAADGSQAPFQQVTGAEATSLQQRAAEHCKRLAMGMLDRSLLLIASRIGEASSVGACLAEAYEALSLEKKDNCRAKYGVSSQEGLSAALGYGLDLASKFLTSDVPAESVWGAAKASVRIAEQRKGVLQEMLSMLRTVSFSSVRQIMISTFTSGPVPAELQRCSTRFHIGTSLYTCRKVLVDEVRSELANLYDYLSGLLVEGASGTLDRADVSMIHLVLSTLHSLQIEMQDVVWLAKSGIVGKLGQIMTCHAALTEGASGGRSAVDIVDAESLKGLHDAAFDVLTKFTNNVAQLLRNKGGESSPAADELLRDALRIGQELVTSLNSFSASESRDLQQMKVAVWLFGLVCTSERVGVLLVQRPPLLQALLRWCLNSDAPIVQRVALQLVGRVLTSDGVSRHVQAIPEEELAQLLVCESGDDVVNAIFANVGGVLSVPTDEEVAEPAPAENEEMDEGSASRRSWTRPLGAGASEGDAKGGDGQWMVMAMPTVQGKQLSSEAQQELEQACLKAMKTAQGAKEAESEASKQQAKEVATAVAAGDKTRVMTGTYEDCQTLCMHWEAKSAITVVLRVSARSEDAAPLWRWYSGHSRYSSSREQLSFLRALQRSPVFGKVLMKKVSECLVRAMGHLDTLAVESPEPLAELQKGLAALDLLSGDETDFEIRQGSRVKLPPIGTAGRFARRMGVVVRCDRLAGTVAVLTEEAVLSRSLQPLVPIVLPMVLVQPAVSRRRETKVDASDSELASGGLQGQYLEDVLRCFLKLQAAQPPSSVPQNMTTKVLQRLKAMSSRALSVLLESGALAVSRVLSCGLLPTVVECASQHAAFQNARPLEMRSAAVNSLLCEASHKAPTSLLTHARSTNQGGGGGGSEGGGAGSVSASSLTQSRVQRGMPSMESFIRTSRALQRQDQRRARELAAANLADITGQPVRLCQLALDRENGNQDRAANWLFEHGEGFLAEHPEFAEVPEGGGDGNNAAVSSADDPDSPLYLLRDVFSYHDEGHGTGLGGEEQGMGAPGAVAGGGLDLPPSVLDELRAITHPLGDQERVYDERVFGSTLLSRSRGGQAMPLPQRRSVPDTDLRVGMSVTLTDADLDVHQSGMGLNGQRLTGQTMFVDSVGWGADSVKVMCYDEATALVHSQIVPTSNLEKVSRVPGPHLDVDTTNAEAMGRALAETDSKLGSLYARTSLRAVLARWPQSEPVHESVFGGRKALLQVLQAAAVGHCVLTADVSQPFATSKRAERHDGEAATGSLSELLRGVVRRLISNELQDAPSVPVGMSMVNPSPERKREREEEGGVGEGSPGEVTEMMVRDKRRKHGKDSPAGGQPAKVASATSCGGELEFNKVPEDSVAPLGHCLVDECLKALKAALSNIATVEEASDHPYVRANANSQGAQRRCLHVEGSALLFVVFDSRCALLSGETIRFFSDAACTDLLACAVQDEMRKVYLPLVLPSPVWMQVGQNAGTGEEGESSWGFRVLGLPMGEVNMAFGIWLLSLLVNRSPARSIVSLPWLRMTVLLEAVLDLLEKSATVAAPHSMQLHSLASLLIPDVGKLPDGLKLLAHHPAFPKLISETGHRHQWESRLVSGSGIRPIGDLTKFPLSTYVCSVTEVLAARAVALGSVARPTDGGDEMQVELGVATAPEWLNSLDQTMGIAACLYGGRQRELDALVRQGCETFKEDSLVVGEEGEEVALLEGEELSLVAREALLELFEVEPEAAMHVASSLVPPQPPANKGRAFLSQACALAQQDRAKMWQLLSSHDFDRFLVRWGPDRDADLVSLVNMLSESEGTVPNKIKAAGLSITDYHRRKLTRLGAVPEASLRRRFVLLKLFNHHLDRALPLIDFSRRFSSSIASTVCELQHLIFYSTKSAFVNAVLEWTACPSRNTERHALTVLLHRPGRWARDPKEKAEEHERWRLQIASEDDRGVKLEELLVAPSDFGSAREMGADATVSGRLVLAEPPNGSLPLRNADEIKGNVALIERGGGQFVNVVRRAQEAGAMAVVMADSKEGPLFLMSTELGNSGDDVTIPAVLVSLADSMLLMQRQGTLVATITADGVLMQTYRQLRYVSSMRLRQRDEMAWRVTFHGEGHQGFNGPYREALSALCQELQSPQLPLLIPCANASGSVADNRDKYVPRPSSATPELLDMFYFIGQLMGVAMRTRNLLSLDFPSMVWKALVGAELEEEDLKATDFSCWNALQFRDEDGQAITAAKFSELFHCSFTTCLTDGTEVALLPDGATTPVSYERREEYRALVVKARLGESAEQLSKMRAGLCSVIPEPLLGLITWEELERRVCGSPDVDVASLRRHTRYRGGLEGSEAHIQMFWEVLEGFSQADRRLFLRFAWGRERLPLESDYTEHSEMKLFPSDRGNGDQVLPEAETCFFIVKLPQYRSKELMQENLIAAITACREINY